MKHCFKLALISVVFFYSCSINKADYESQNTDQNFPVVELKTMATPYYREYVADVHAVKNVEIYARVKGYLEQIFVDEGKEVKKGQSLFRINSEEYKSELSQAKAALSHAIAEAKAMELEVDRVKSMVDKQVISKTELGVAKAKLAALKAKIEEATSAQSNAELRLEHTHIKAPFDGVVDRIPLKTGSLINEGTLLTTVSDIQSVYAYFNVSEMEYLEFVKSRKQMNEKSKDVVELILADGTNFPYQGKIETMEGEFNTGTGSIAFRARFPNPEKLLKHGSTGTIRLTSTMKKALIVPQKATFEIQDKNFVFIVDEKNKVKMKSFIPKLRFDHFYIVEKGLKPGDKIVYEGVQKLKDGMEINPSYVSLDTLVAFTDSTHH